MQLYRFSPIESKEKLVEAILYIHQESMRLCYQVMGRYLPVAGNVGVFCHYLDEYELLVSLREHLCASSDNPKQKYFALHQPISFDADGELPVATYTDLYIRYPDPYRHHVGDIDVFLADDEYLVLKQSLIDGKQIPGARQFPRTDLDMIELYDPDSDVLVYISTKSMTDTVKVKQL